jgi:tetratricopeptide (TPR) repeat protein
LALERLPLRALALCVAAGLAAACWGDRSLEDVRALQDQGLHADAEAPLRALLGAAPDDPELNFRLGLALARTGRSSEAVFPLRKAARSEEFAGQSGQLLAALLFDMRNFDEAIREADLLIARDPADQAAWFVRGSAAEEVGRFEAALESADAILAAQPENLDALALRGRSLSALKRFAEAEAAYRRVQQAGAADPARAASACFALAQFLGEVRKDAAGAARVAEQCLASYRDDPSAPAAAAIVYDAIDRRDEATRIVREGLGRWPEHDELRALLSGRLVDSGALADAEAVLLEGIDRAAGPDRWLAVADVRRRRGDLEGALLAVEQASATPSSGAEELGFAAADLLFELGRVDEAEARMREVKEPAYRLVLDGRLALERGDAKRALEILTRAIEQWPQNAGARIQAARAANQLGDLERAKSELREATRAAPKDTDAALLLARLYLVEGDVQNAAAFLTRHHDQRGFTTPDAYLLAGRTLVAAGEPAEARRVLGELRGQEGRAGLAVGALAELAAGEEGPAAAVRLVEDAKLDLAAPANEPALRAWLRAQLAQGNTGAAAAQLDALLASHPDQPSLHALRGQMLLAAGDLEGAERAFDAALALSGEHPAAQAGKGWVALRRGDAARAALLLESAAARDPGEPDYAYGAAQARLAAGDEAGAAEALEKLLRLQPEHAGAANELAFLLARRGESLDLALRLAERAARLAPSPEVSDTLGFVRWRRGEEAAARSAFEAALAARPDYATALYHLALVQQAAGDAGGARASLERALAGEPFPEAEEARRLLAQLGSSAGG